MDFPSKTIDLPCDLLLPVGGSFHHRPIGEFAQSQWAPMVRSGGIRQKLWVPTVQAADFLRNRRVDRRYRFETFIDRLDGSSVAFRLWDPWCVYPRGVGAGIWNPIYPDGRRSHGEYVIDGAYLIDGQYHIDGGSTLAYVGENAPRYADSILMTGLVPNATVFKEGDKFEVGGNLYRVMDDALSDSNGDARVLLSWKLWRPAVVGDQINLHKPTGRFVLADVDQGIIERAFSTGQASISAIEVPYVE